MKKIESKIVGFKVVQPSEAEAAYAKLDATKEGIVELPPGTTFTVNKKEPLKRPLVCNSKTYRLKPPQAEHALYVTISSIEQDGRKYPFELFFNTKNPNHIEWTSALTLTISIAFRTAIETGSSLSGLISNLKETFGTSGSYLSKVPSKPKFVNGLVAEVGLVLESFNNECLAYEASGEVISAVEIVPETDSSYKSKGACSDCGGDLISLDGCLTCIQCGASKCG